MEGFVCYRAPTKVIKNSDGRGRAAPEVGAAGLKKICTNFLKTDHLYVLIYLDWIIRKYDLASEWAKIQNNNIRKIMLENGF